MSGKTKTRLTGIECASALEYRELRTFIALHPQRAGARFIGGKSVLVTDESKWRYILGLHSGREISAAVET